MLESKRAIVIGVEIKLSQPLIPLPDSLNELEELGKTAGLQIIETFIQYLPRRAQGTYIGTGKVHELQAFIKDHQIHCVLTDDELTPAQSKFLEKELNTKVMDRTGLILDIFAQRAQTYEAKLQIELAQLNYLLPRLTRLWTHLSRLGGGIGTRGPGETQLESDKRQISRRVSHIKKKLKKIKTDRHLRRKPRQQLSVLSGAIVGYTNAGKSTLMNRLTSSHVLVEDKLFATLDPTSRTVTSVSSTPLIVTDTVGFIQKLPTHLIKAFYSTLEEVTEADFLIHVIDVTHPCILEFIETSQTIISNLNADNKPVLYVFNKWDLVTKPNTTLRLIEKFQPQICISATTDTTLDNFFSSLDSILSCFKTKQTYFIPYSRMDIIHLFHKYGHVESIDYTEQITITVTINELISKKILGALYHHSTLNPQDSDSNSLE